LSSAEKPERANSRSSERGRATWPVNSCAAVATDRHVLDVTVGRAGLPVGDILGAVEGVERVEKVGGAADAPPAGSGRARLRLHLDRDPALVLGPVAQTLAGHDCPVTHVRIGEPSLEDVFIGLTGRSLR